MRPWREGRPRPVPVELHRLRWVAVVLPVAFILLMEGLRLLLVERDPAQQNGHLALAGMMLVGAVTFAIVMFLGIESTQRHLVRQNRELAAVNAVSTAVQGELGLEVIIDAALESVIESTGATEADIRVFAQEGIDGDPGLERRLVASEHASPLAGSGQTVPHLIDIPLSTGTTIVGRMQLHLAEGVAEPDLLATATLNNIGHQLASSIQIGQLVRGLQRSQHEDHRLYGILLQVADQGDLAETLSMVVRDARELLGADEAAMCLSEVGARAVEFDGTRMPAPASDVGTTCIHHGDDRFVPQHDRRATCPMRASVGDGPSIEAPVRGPDGMAYGVIWLGRRARARLHRPRAALPGGALGPGLDRHHQRPDARERAAGRHRRRARADRPRDARQPGPDPRRDPPAPARAGRPFRGHGRTRRGSGARRPGLALGGGVSGRPRVHPRACARPATPAGRFCESISAYLEKYSHQAGIAGVARERPRPGARARATHRGPAHPGHPGGADERAQARGGVPGRRPHRRPATTACASRSRTTAAASTSAARCSGRDGFGLHTMQERIELVGGTLTIESTPGQGTTVVAVVPGWPAMVSR